MGRGNRRGYSERRETSVRSPTERAKFIFLRLANPLKANTNEKRKTPHVRAMFRKPIGREDLETVREEDDERSSSSVSKRSSASSAVSALPVDLFRAGKHKKKGGIKNDRFSVSGDESVMMGASSSASSASSTSSSSVAANKPPHKSLKREKWVPWAAGESSASEGDASSPAAATLELDARIATAAKRIAWGDEGHDDDGAGDIPRREARRAIEQLGFRERRDLMKRERMRSAEARMVRAVDENRLGYEALLDADLARDVEMKIDMFDRNEATREDDLNPDAYDTDELLSDATLVSSTDEEFDTPRRRRRRKEVRRKHFRQKRQVLRRRRRESRVRMRAEVDRTYHAMFDDLIEQALDENRSLRPPPPRSTLEAKRSWLNNATRKAIVQRKMEQMRTYLLMIAAGIETIASLIKFPKLFGLTEHMEAALKDPKSDRMVAQLARKHLRRGPSSPEWSFLIMFASAVGTMHVRNVKQEASGEGAQKGQGPDKVFGAISKIGKFVAPLLGINISKAAPEAPQGPKPNYVRHEDEEPTQENMEDAPWGSDDDGEQDSGSSSAPSSSS